jgi:hypothetical protein
MSDEVERDELRRALTLAIGAENAARLMERIPPVTWDELARRQDVLALRSDLDTVKVDVGALKTDVGALKTDVGALKTDVGALKVGLASLEERVEFKSDALRHEVIGEFRRQMVEQNRLLFFSMIGAIFTAASLAFAAANF